MGVTVKSGKKARRRAEHFQNIDQVSMLALGSALWLPLRLAETRRRRGAPASVFRARREIFCKWKVVRHAARAAAARSAGPPCAADARSATSSCNGVRGERA